MPPVQIASLSLKILGIYSFIQAIPLIRAFVHAIGFPVDGRPMRLTLILGSSVSLVLFFALGIVLIFFSQPIAKRMISQSGQTVSLKTIDTRVLQAMAFSIAGIVLMCLAIPKLFQLAVIISAHQQPGIETPMREKISNDTLAYGIATAFQFIVGLLLFLGAQFLTHLWHLLIERFKFEKNIASD